jgi:phage major head subunit gpT-like protein
MIINTSNLATLFQSYNAAFKKGLKLGETEWQSIATLVPSSSESNLYAFLGQFPKLRKWIGDRIIKSMATHDYSVKNEDFESTVGVSRNKIDDDQYGVFSTLFEEMGYAAKVHPDEIIFALLLLGESELCYDGQPFFDANHPVKGGVASNYDSSGGGNLWCLMDTKRPLKPMIFQKRQDYKFQAFTKMSDEHVFKTKEFVYGVDARVNAGFGLWQLAYGSKNTLNQTNFDAYQQAMMELKSDEGRPLGVKPNLLVCGPSNHAAARSLILTEKLANGATNPLYKAVDVHVSPYML